MNPHDRFPRLHLAWQQERTAYLARRQLRHDLMKLEGLVAHRELQLVRAMSRNDRRYGPPPTATESSKPCPR